MILLSFMDKTIFEQVRLSRATLEFQVKDFLLFPFGSKLNLVTVLDLIFRSKTLLSKRNLGPWPMANFAPEIFLCLTHFGTNKDEGHT